MVAASGDKITVITLGPEGTCHERAVQRYLEFQGVDEYRIELITDFFVGLEMLRETPNAFLVQCSAHPKVHEITEKYWREVFVVDTFIYPTKHLVLLSRRDVERAALDRDRAGDQGLRRPLPVGGGDRRRLQAGRRRGPAAR